MRVPPQQGCDPRGAPHPHGARPARQPAAQRLRERPLQSGLGAALAAPVGKYHRKRAAAIQAAAYRIPEGAVLLEEHALHAPRRERPARLDEEQRAPAPHEAACAFPGGVHYLEAGAAAAHPAGAHPGAVRLRRDHHPGKALRALVGKGGQRFRRHCERAFQRSGRGAAPFKLARPAQGRPAHRPRRALRRGGGGGGGGGHAGRAAAPSASH